MPKKTRFAAWLIAPLFLVALAVFFYEYHKPVPSPADRLAAQAGTLAGQAEYKKAAALYQQAWQQYKQENNSHKTAQMHDLMFRMNRAGADYTYTLPELQELLAKTFPTIAPVERNAWISEGKVRSLVKNGQTYYDAAAVNNILYRNKALMHTVMAASYPQAFKKEYDYIIKNPKGFSSTVKNPAPSSGTYEITETVKIPRADLPRTGTLKIWMPAPVEKEDQKDVQILALEPKGSLAVSPNPQNDIGLAQFNFSLDTLKDDIAITAKFKFVHLEQNFIIDPAKVGEYDKNSELYRQYTRSYNNIEITPEIIAKAKEIAGSETNPYLQAKKVYEYILDNVYYSLMPHVTLAALNRPESTYVHKNGYGDCGAQSMYFAALMRSLGVPARAAGGYQILPMGPGPHFWAEFYLPNYGWVPVDTTIAEGADDAVNISEADKVTFKNYYFGNLDQYRYNIQKDVDMPLVSPWQDPPIVPAAIQQATADCPACETDLNWAIAEKYWDIKLKQIK